MNWQVILALVLAVPVILIPIALIWYVNVTGIFTMLRETAKRRTRIAKLVKQTTK